MPDVSEVSAVTAMWRARLALIERQRRFEWELALGEGRAAGVLLARGHAHDLRNMVQVMELGLMALERRVGAAGAIDTDVRELFDELQQTLAHGKATLEQVTGSAPARAPSAGAIVRPAIEAALASLRPVVPAALVLDVRIEVASGTQTDCTAAELEEIVVRAVLDAVAVQREAGRIAVIARDRRIDGRPWIELLCEHAGAPVPDATPAAGSALAVIGVIAARVGGEVTVSPTRTGGVELVVALPAG